MRSAGAGARIMFCLCLRVYLREYLVVRLSGVILDRRVLLHGFLKPAKALRRLRDASGFASAVTHRSRGVKLRCAASIEEDHHSSE